MDFLNACKEADRVRVYSVASDGKLKSRDRMTERRFVLWLTYENCCWETLVSRI